MGAVIVAAGGAIGASLRYGATLLFARSEPGAFPWHTLGVNVAGAFLLGLLMALLPQGETAEQWRLFLGVGVLGGFTTFSTFSYEALSLAQSGSWVSASGYVLGSVFAALVAVAAGYALGRALV